MVCIRAIMLLFVVLISACGSDGSKLDKSSLNDEYYGKKMAANLHQASLWLIEDGVMVFSEKGKVGLHRKLVDKWGVLLWVDPWIESEEYLAQFRVKARGISYTILNMHRERVDGSLYEMWVAKVTAKPWSVENNRSVFYVTVTDSVYGSRQILKESDQYIDAYSVNGIVVSIPTDNPRVLYDLQAWEYPNSYRDSDLKDKKVYMDSSGNILFE